jgi:hypothetical protein
MAGAEPEVATRQVAREVAVGKCLVQGGQQRIGAGLV